MRQRSFELLLLVFLLTFGFIALGNADEIPWPEVSSAKELKIRMGGESTYVFIYSEKCIGTPFVVKRIKMYEKHFKFKIIAWKVPMGSKLPDTPYDIVAVPQLNFFADNKRRDALFGWTARKSAEDKFLFDFLKRTSQPERKRTFVQVSEVVKEKMQNETQILKGLGKHARFPFDLTSFDFSNMEIKRNMAFVGAKLVGVKFQNAFLDRVAFAGADLTGANFSSAKLSRIFWGSCICPDGTRSDANGMSCENNLKIKSTSLK